MCFTTLPTLYNYYIEETDVAPFNKAESIHHRFDVVEGLSSGIGYNV